MKLIIQQRLYQSDGLLHQLLRPPTVLQHLQQPSNNRQQRARQDRLLGLPAARHARHHPLEELQQADHAVCLVELRVLAEALQNGRVGDKLRA